MRRTQESRFAERKALESWFAALTYDVNCHRIALPIDPTSTPEALWRRVYQLDPSWTYYENRPKPVLIREGAILPVRVGAEDRHLFVFEFLKDIEAEVSIARALPEGACPYDPHGGEGGAVQFTFSREEKVFNVYKNKRSELHKYDIIFRRATHDEHTSLMLQELCDVIVMRDEYDDFDDYEA